MKCLWLIVIFLAAACGAPRSTGGPIKPAAPGPIDLLRGVWGDYGGRCPSDYQYCKGHAQSVCCPIGSRCEEDAGGSYCAPRTAAAGSDTTVGDSPAPRCEPDEIACSYRGRTTCCASDQRCCTIDGAPGCCE